MAAVLVGSEPEHDDEDRCRQPDNVYMRANISGKYNYRIIGTRGTVPLITFGSRVNRYHIDGTMLQTGDLHIHDLEVDENGRFEFIASVDKPDEGAWLPLAPDSNLISVRQTHQGSAQRGHR
ncbi:hypothetical protein ACETU7_33205 [Rhodococcus sp. 3Y1]